MGVWGMVRGLTAMWELKASKVSSSVIVTVWLAQIGRAAASTWLPCSSLHHGTEQPCTSAPAHQTRSGTHTELGSHRVAHADTRPRVRRFGERAKQFDCEPGAIRQSGYLELCREWKAQGRSCLLHMGKSTSANKPSMQSQNRKIQNKTVAVLNRSCLDKYKWPEFINSYLLFSWKGCEMQVKFLKMQPVIYLFIIICREALTLKQVLKVCICLTNIPQQHRFQCT